MDSWLSVLRALEMVAPNLSGSSIGAEDATSRNAVPTESKLNGKRRSMAKRHDLINRLLEMHREEEEGVRLLDKRLHNAKTSIGRLPTEILLFILELANAPRPLSPFGDFQITPSNPIPFAGVCHRWIHVVLGRSGAPLWTRVTSGPGFKIPLASTIRRLAAYIPRSGTLPIEIRVNRTYGLDNNAEALADVLLGAANRCQTLTLDSSTMASVLCPLSAAWVNLAHLSVDYHRWYDAENHIDYHPALFSSIDFPNLRQLSLHSIYGFWMPRMQSHLASAPACSRITKLDLLDVKAQGNDLCQILQLFPNLVRFRSAYSDEHEWYDGGIDIPKFVMPSLETIQFVHAAPPPAFFDVLVATSLRSIQSIDGGVSTLQKIHENCPHVDTLETMRPSTPGDPFPIANIMQDHGSIHSIFLRDSMDELAASLQDIIDAAREKADATMEEDGGSAGDGSDSEVPLVLAISPEESEWIYAQRTAAERRQSLALVECLEVLARMRHGRSLAYGPRFSLRLASRLGKWWPGVAEVVARFPEFYEFGDLKEFEVEQYTA